MRIESMSGSSYETGGNAQPGLGPDVLIYLPSLVVSTIKFPALRIYLPCRPVFCIRCF